MSETNEGANVTQGGTENGRPEQPPSVYDYLAAAIQQMSHVAWQKMGMRPDSMSGKYEKNLSEAKVAIDATVALTALLEPQLDEEDRRQTQRVVKDLRINFVQKSTE